MVNKKTKSFIIFFLIFIALALITLFSTTFSIFGQGAITIELGVPITDQTGTPIKCLNSIPEFRIGANKVDADPVISLINCGQLSSSCDSSGVKEYLGYGINYLLETREVNRNICLYERQTSFQTTNCRVTRLVNSFCPIGFERNIDNIKINDYITLKSFDVPVFSCKSGCVKFNVEVSQGLIELSLTDIVELNINKTHSMLLIINNNDGKAFTEYSLGITYNLKNPFETITKEETQTIDLTSGKNEISIEIPTQASGDLEIIIEIGLPYTTKEGIKYLQVATLTHEYSIKTLELETAEQRIEELESQLQELTEEETTTEQEIILEEEVIEESEFVEGDSVSLIGEENLGLFSVINFDSESNSVLIENKEDGTTLLVDASLLQQEVTNNLFGIPISIWIIFLIIILGIGIYWRFKK